MRFIDFRQWSLPLTNEEDDFLCKFATESILYKNKLTEREQEIANNLVVKSIIIRKKLDDGIVYKQAKAR